MANLLENTLEVAENLIKANRQPEALQLLAKFLKQNPYNEQGWYLLTLVLEDPQKKQFALERVLALNPQHAQARKALLVLTEKPTEEQTDPLEQVVEWIKNNQRPKARALLEPYLQQHPESEAGWYLLGIARSNPPQKAKAFQRVLQLNPANEKARQQLQKLEKRAATRQTHPIETAQTHPLIAKITSSTFYRIMRYTVSRVIAMLLTIFVGVFITVMIANKNGQLDANIFSKIDTQTRHEVGLLNTDEKKAELAETVAAASHRAGLDLPYLPRHLRWTVNALTFDWGRLMINNYTAMYFSHFELTEVKDVLLDRLPNSLLLIATANLIIFIIGIPLALRLSRRQHAWQDKLFSFLAPISSIPSWILGLILILIFAVETQLLPPSGMLDSSPPADKWGYILVVGRHMILPVSAIILSLIFQLVYTWRTYFLIYSSEDYVELARAKGLEDNLIEKRYILKPSAPFVITSFSLTLVGFWQMSIALEIIFNWPGIGQLYIDALPHFWGESMFPGEMIVAVSLVVLFAYILGFIVLVLDVVYALIDPRVRIGNQGIRVAHKTSRRVSFWKRNPSRIPARSHTMPAKTSHVQKSGGIHFQFKPEIWRARLAVIGKTLSEMRRYPSAIAGLTIILIMVGGSLYAVIAMPYADIGTRWVTESVTGYINAPKLAQPAWINLFRKDKFLSTIDLKEQDPGVTKVAEAKTENSGSVTYEFSFDYNYSAMPEEIYLRLAPHYQEKRPFANLTWITPDQREIGLQGFSVESEKNFDVLEMIPRKLKVDSDLIAERPYGSHGNLYALPLFVPPDTDGERPLPGKYTLRVEGLMFEDGGDLGAELILLGQVYGAAGTDFMRRDLLVPLLWGMPFALLFGLFGATVTTILSMFLAAAGTWYGGWLDSALQRVNEAVMLLPILAIAVLFYAFFNISIWSVMLIIVVLNIFGSQTKAFRAAFLQVRESSYVEAAQAYGAKDIRIITRYLIPRIIPVLIPQLVALIPSYVFLEATLGIFNINSIYPTWGKVIHDALTHGVSWGSRYWVLEPISLLLLTGFAFAMVGFALDQILNPKLKDV